MRSIAVLKTQSGLLGISGLTNDMKVLDEELSQHDDRRVRLAIEVFCYRARKYIGAYLACMGGADAVVFTGGTGEHSPEIRARICAGLEWAGLTIAASQNQQAVGREGPISTEGSSLHAWVIPTNEELVIARDTVRFVLGETHPVVAARTLIPAISSRRFPPLDAMLVPVPVSVGSFSTWKPARQLEPTAMAPRRAEPRQKTLACADRAGGDLT